MRNYKLYLKDILNAMESIEEFVDRGIYKKHTGRDKAKVSTNSMERNGWYEG